MRCLLAQHRGAVGGVQDQLRLLGLQRPRPLRESLELRREEPFVIEVVGSGEMRHQPNQLHSLGVSRGRHGTRSLRRIARTEPSHAGIELHVHAPAAGGSDRLHLPLVPYDHIRIRRERFLQLHSGQRSHHEHAHLAESRLAQLFRLDRPGDRQPARAASQRGASALHRAVAVSVGLHHDAQLRAVLQLTEQAGAIALYRGHVHPGLRAALRHPPPVPTTA